MAIQTTTRSCSPGDTMNRSLRTIITVTGAAAVLILSKRTSALSLSDIEFDSVLNCSSTISQDLKPGCYKSAARIRDELQNRATRKVFFGSCLMSTGAACAALGVSSFLVPVVVDPDGVDSRDRTMSQVGKAAMGVVALALAGVQLKYSIKGFRSASADWRSCRSIKRSSNAHGSTITALTR
jgi:hypothetical protein